ncbi:MAG TPA: DUF1684 domain-containing protein [Thermoanaerobaculia bacterium]|jgi:hypothetical protein|nr:DUF1684 domain-containing protein [Thermoanaerobaculia bacterium]
MTPKPKTFAAILLLATLAAGAAALAAGSSDTAVSQPDLAAWRQQVETWKKERTASLKREDGWLTLVGLYWLKPGENRFGSDPGNPVILPKGKSPAVAGSLIREGDAVTLRAEPGANLTVDGKPVTGTVALKSDADGKPTALGLGSLSFYVIKRGDRLGVRIKDKESPERAAFHGVDTFPPDPQWRVVARFEPYKDRKIPITNILGQVADEPSPGAVVFDWRGKTYRLDALGDPKEGLSLIFGDTTNGKSTYGAGRFLDTAPPKDGTVVVDFNTAYNPPCAFTAFATCPLPPAQNKLALAVEAGEKKFTGGPEH